MWELPRRMKALNIIINNKIVFFERQMRLLLDIEFHLRIIFAVFHWDWPFLYVIQFQIRDDRMRNAIVIDYDLEWVCFRAFFRMQRAWVLVIQHKKWTQTKNDCSSAR